MTAPRLIKSIGRSFLRLALFLIPLVLVCFALSPAAQAKDHPTPTPTPTPTATPSGRSVTTVLGSGPVVAPVIFTVLPGLSMTIILTTDTVAWIPRERSGLQVRALSLKRANLRRKWSTIRKSALSVFHDQPSRFTAWRLFVSCIKRSHTLKSPACSCVSITLPKRQLKLPGDHQAVPDSRGEVSDRRSRRFAKQKGVTDETNSFVA